MAKLKTESAEPKTQGDMRNHNTRMQLLSYVERHERLQEERDTLGEDQKEVMAEAKGLGFDTKTLRKVIARRKLDSGARMEADSLLELYEDVIIEAEKQQKNQSLADAGEPAAPKKNLMRKPAPDPRQSDIEDVVAPSDEEVVATAAQQISRAADHPEDDDKPDVGNIPSFLRRQK